MKKEYDIEQQRAINALGGYYLVLAPPGCGKTDILAERIVRARQMGIALDDMLCLTFTNRAARGMLDRVEERIGEDSCGIFVGNIHRYCSRFLRYNELIPSNSTIIDEDDMADIIGEYCGRSVVDKVDRIDAYISQRILGHPDSAIFLPNDGYKKYYKKAKAAKFDFAKVKKDNSTDSGYLYKALYFHQYKATHNLISFSDLLIRAYEELRKDKEHKFKRYKWIQVDEVQDLNALQIAIIDELLDKSGTFTVMYLGDGQQTIYSFLGAKHEQLDILKRRCRRNILTLGTNHRTPKYILDVLNTYAVNELNVDPSPLPTTANNAPKGEKDLLLITNDNEKEESLRISEVIEYYLQNGDERTAFLVHSNKEANRISEYLSSKDIQHFNISGRDIFKSKTYKTLLSFFQVCLNNFNMMAWAHLLYGVGVVNRLEEARELVFGKLKSLMMTPMDLIQGKSYIAHFYEEYMRREFVFFDTETTGLDVNEDDIVQIAAFKVKCGKRLAGSEFNIFIHTDKQIPSMLGDMENPLIEAYANAPHYDREEGLRMFIDYIDGRPVFGHNVDYDYNILRNNVKRSLGESISLETYDSLKLIRYVEPNLRKYKLKYLLENLHIEGRNSHLADDDIAATKSIVDYCCHKFLLRQEQAMDDTHDELKRLADKSKVLLPLFEMFQQHAHNPIEAKESPLAEEIKRVYEYMKQGKLIDETPNEREIRYPWLYESEAKMFLGYEKKFEIFLQYVREEWMDHNKDNTLFNQLSNHISDMAGIKEGDLVNLIKEKILVTTVHKAKGLEFENVIITNANDSCYPLFTVNNVLNNPKANKKELKMAKQKKEEAARVFYVALSRAKKRICISYINKFVSPYGNTYKRNLTPFMASIRQFFQGEDHGRKSLEKFSFDRDKLPPVNPTKE